MKRIFLVVCLLVLAGCSPVDMYIAKTKRLEAVRYGIFQDPQYTHNIEREKAFWEHAKTEFPNDMRILDIIGTLNSMRIKKDAGQELGELPTQYAQQTNLFWTQEREKTAYEQVRYQGMAAGFSQGMMMQQRQMAPPPNRFNCITNQYGNSTYTNCY